MLPILAVLGIVSLIYLFIFIVALIFISLMIKDVEEHSNVFGNFESFFDTCSPFAHF